MGKSRRIKLKSKTYLGVVAGEEPRAVAGDEEPRIRLSNMRPHRFAALDGEPRATDILTELVNLPDDPKSRLVSAFIEKKWDLALGGSDSGGRLPDSMSPDEVIRLRGLYREFWKPLASDVARGLIVEENPHLNKSDGEGGYFQDPEEVNAAIAAKDPKELEAAVAKAKKKGWGTLGSYKARLFMQRLGPDLGAFQSPISEMDAKARQAYLDEQKSIFPLQDYRDGALRIDWKTGALTVAARGPIDHLTHAVYQHRNRLRECPACEKLFVAFGSNESFCPFGCGLERERERKRKDATRRRAALRVDGLTSRGNKPRRKLAH